MTSLSYVSKYGQLLPVLSRTAPSREAALTTPSGHLLCPLVSTIFIILYHYIYFIYLFVAYYVSPTWIQAPLLWAYSRLWNLHKGGTPKILWNVKKSVRDLMSQVSPQFNIHPSIQPIHYSRQVSKWPSFNFTHDFNAQFCNSVVFIEMY